MSDYLTALTGAGTTVAVGLTAISRLLPTPPGRHRAKRPLLLPDEPLTEQTIPMHRVVLCESELARLLDTDRIVANESADCPTCERNTFHAMNRNGSRRCWTCQTETPAGAA
jgi:hypothetical protein